MNMRKAVAAAMGSALLAAGTGVVVSGPAHGVLSNNSTGAAANKNSANGNNNTASASGTASCDCFVNLKNAAGAHQNIKGVSQNLHHKAHTGNSSAATHGSAKSGSQSFRVR